MDQYGQIGPEKGAYAQDVREVSRLITGGTAYVRLADKGTQLHLYLTLKRDLCVSGWLPDGLDEDNGIAPWKWIFVAIPEKGAYWFDMSGYVAPAYVASKLGLTSPDAETLAEFLKRLHHELAPMGAAA